jgi:DNA-binding NarL/FixJ family response regulator
MTEAALRVVVADDHAIVREGVVALLVKRGIQVVAEGRDGAEAVALAKEHEPDVVVIDLSMPGLGGEEGVRRLRELPKAPKIVVLSMHTDRERVLRVLKAGATGYVVKGGASGEIGVAVAAAARGERYLSAEVRAFGQETDTAPESPLDLLTPREREVLQLVAEGHTNASIAAKLGVSAKTVDTHRTNLMQKLNLHDVAAVTRFAVKHGLVSTES